MDRVAIALMLLACGALAGEARAEPTPSGTIHWFGASSTPLEPSAGLALGRSAPPAEGVDEDALSILVSFDAAATAPKTVTLTSVRAPETSTSRAALEILERPMEATACPSSIRAGQKCAKIAPLRLVFDDIDRRDPLLSSRSILAELGGAISVSGEGLATETRRVVGQLGRQRATLRVKLVRLVPKGPAPIGRDSDDAVRLAREEIDRASAIWSSCGVSFGQGSLADVEVVDPPPPFLLSLGCDAPVDATGGELSLLVDGKDLTVSIPKGTSPRGAARIVASAVGKMGFKATVSDNGTSHAATFGSSDVLVRRKNGSLATLSAPKKGAVSTDPTLDACIGRVDLEDGLHHFTDADAVAGTLEERTLVKAFDDGDPSTFEVLVIPSFGGDTRIGESFIFLERGAIRNVVLEDRAGFRAQRASYTLAHELGHVLLDQPGHPDDFAGDTPTSLMDADAVSSTAFGPRRLSPAECERAARQSGERSVSRALSPWPLSALDGPSKKAKR